MMQESLGHGMWFMVYQGRTLVRLNEGEFSAREIRHDDVETHYRRMENFTDANRRMFDV